MNAIVPENCKYVSPLMYIMVYACDVQLSVGNKACARAHVYVCVPNERKMEISLNLWCVIIMSDLKPMKDKQYMY